MFHKRDRFGRLKNPQLAYAYYLAARTEGRTRLSWRTIQAQYRARLRRRKLAKRSRRANRRK